ncbi:MAG TPA: SPOR domain-containing protein [Rhodopila sp.]
MDPDTRRLVLFAGGLGAVLVALIGASALIGHRSSEVPVVVADSRPIRVKPDNPGGMKIDGAENDVFSGGSDTANAKLAPPPENPDAKALRTTAAPPAPVAEPPAPVAVAPPPAPVAKPPVALAPPPAPATKPAAVAIARPVPAAPAKPAQVAAAKPPAQAAAETHAPAAGRQTMVQLAALTSEEAARSEWQQLSKRMPDLLGSRQPSFSRTERDGHTFWRVRTSGFADLAQARSFCEHVRAKGASCSVAEF